MKTKVGIEEKKVVVITGVSSGIGKDTAAVFLRRGWTVVGLSRTPLDDSYVCDVTNSKRVQEVFDDIYQKYGRIDVLINNAGFGISGATELLPDEEIKKEYDVNVIGVINCYKSVVKYMK